MKRRSFMHQATCAAVGYTTLFSTLFNLKAISASASANSAVNDCNDYRALVCFLMAGGNDSYNMLVPFEGTEYADYSTTREDLALGNGLNGTADELIELSFPAGSSVDRTLGVHHKLAGLKSLYDLGELAFIANVGALAQPVANVSEYYNPNTNLPLNLYSHSDQQRHWQTASPMTRSGFGWGGKIADMIDTASCNNTISINVSLSGTNVFQAGVNSFSYVISPYSGSIGIQNYGEGNSFYNLRDAAVDNMLDHNYQEAFKNAYSAEVENANDTHLLFSGAISSVSLTTTFGTSRLAKSMEMIAKTIAAATMTTPNPTALSPMKRQIFYVDMGGFDMHKEVLAAQADIFEDINDSLMSFNAAMKELNVNDKVTTFGMSEFARTCTSNGQGSDHGWGGNVFVMGGAVNGGDVYGTYPDIALLTTIELGGGVYIPQTSTDEYFAELALWFGVPKTDLPLIFPNISEFYDVMSANNPIGFL